MIPKIIWMTHEFDFDNLQERFKQSYNSWREHNKDYEVIYVSSAERYEMVAQFGTRYINAYKKIISGMYQADYWRILTLSKFGGVYVDADTICIDSLDLPDRDFVVHKVHNENSHDTYTNTYIASSSGYLGMTQILESMTDHVLNLPKDHFVSLGDVGTAAYTKHIKELNLDASEFEWSKISLHGEEEKRIKTSRMAKEIAHCRKCKTDFVEICFDRENNPECDKICEILYNYTYHNIYSKNAILEL